jgi:hypothetical protein
MKFVTREKQKVDRVGCPWLIKKVIDPNAELLFVPSDQVLNTAEREGALPYDVPGNAPRSLYHTLKSRLISGHARLWRR